MYIYMYIIYIYVCVCVCVWVFNANHAAFVNSNEDDALLKNPNLDSLKATNKWAH